MHARVRAGVAATRGLSARRRPRRRRPLRGVCSSAPPPSPGSSTGTHAARRRCRVPWSISYCPRIRCCDAVRRADSTLDARAALCAGRPGLSPLPVPPLRARAPRSRAARRRASHQGRQVPGLKKSRDLRVPCDPVIEQAPRAGAGPLGVSRPPRERVGVGQLRHGQDASRARVGARGLSARLSGPLHHRRRAG